MFCQPSDRAELDGGEPRQRAAFRGFGHIALLVLRAISRDELKTIHMPFEQSSQAEIHATDQAQNVEQGLGIEAGRDLCKGRPRRGRTQRIEPLGGKTFPIPGFCLPSLDQASDRETISVSNAPTL
ncbi:MAG: hypothetical protein JWO65_1719 [Sphingomonas bacterium]|nr:hypothetical protein [Sphingomonas bacterium]